MRILRCRLHTGQTEVGGRFVSLSPPPHHPRALQGSMSTSIHRPLEDMGLPLGVVLMSPASGTHPHKGQLLKTPTSAFFNHPSSLKRDNELLCFCHPALKIINSYLPLFALFLLMIHYVPP